MTVDACLAAYGFLTAVAAPWVLSRQDAIERVPRLGVATWLIAAASVLVSWLAAGWLLANHAGALARGLGIGLVAAIATRLAWLSVRTWWATRSRRCRHVDAAAILGRHDSRLGALVVESPQPVAYCLPRSGGGLVVITTGARSLLSRRQLDAVLAHERAHLDGHHHLLVGIGEVLSRAVPRLRLFRQLTLHLHQLLEMIADDAAARVHGRRTVASAIAAMGSHASPAGALGVGGATARARVLRLIRTDGGGARQGRLGLAVTAILLAAGPYLASLPHCPHPW